MNTKINIYFLNSIFIFYLPFVFQKMKLLLEKEALSKQHMELQKENLDLKSKVQNMNSLHVKEENSCEPTIRHASFVNILLQKEWVVSKIFIILFATTWKAINLR